MNKKKSQKNIPITSIIFSIAIILFLVGFIMVTDAQPNNFYYPLKTQKENLLLNINSGGESEINYRINLAEERIREAKNPDLSLTEFEATLDKYDDELRSIVSLLEKEVPNNPDSYSTVIIDLYQNRISGLNRILLVPRDNATISEIRARYNRSMARTNLRVSEILNIGIDNISTDEFESFARAELLRKLQFVGNNVNFAIEDVQLVNPYITNEQREELQNVLNEIRSRYTAAQQAYGGNAEIKEINDELNETERLINDDLTDLLVALSR